MDNTGVPLEQLVVEIPGHPTSVNHMYRYGKGVMYKVASASKWDFVAQRYIKLEANKTYRTHDLSKYKGLPLRLEIDVCKRSWRCTTKGKTHLHKKPDLDNYSKATIDSLMNALGLDDCAVVELIMRKTEVPREEHVSIRMDFI